MLTTIENYLQSEKLEGYISIVERIVPGYAPTESINSKYFKITTEGVKAIENYKLEIKSKLTFPIISIGISLVAIVIAAIALSN